ncbi:YqiA/YcfP family alpha/beta fold hydrolase [Marinifilum caeruleilacunae]|uniref:Esterase n=1 Tax=Marinifilum caeruleilacunae TaxID=2499076 RepID=A0ABX1WXH0_9BACT|nr:YqiA/YcfP family alpha/beta fold hydrolase [Marinifilum caeruleilacunae]NOU60589.1 hypothetical protein [Marinifilum caeruleilacunae]
MMLYIHGFNSRGEGEKYNKLKTLFPDVPIYSPTYDSSNFDTIDQLLHGIELDENTMFIGCSLGGYLALYFACKYKVKAVLLNPVTNPIKQLTNLLELQKGELNKTDYHHWKANIQKLDKFRVNEIGSTSLSIFVNKDDDVIDCKDTIDFFQDKRSVEVFESGGHRFSDLEKIKKDIEFHYYQI